MSDTDTTDQSQEVTAPAGESSGTSESDNQKALADKLSELEIKLTQYAELEEKTRTLEEEKNKASAEAMRWQATYKGLQRQTTQKLQEAAQAQRQLVDAQQSASQLAELRDTVNLLASKMLDADQAKEFALAQKELQLRQWETRMRSQANVTPTSVDTSYQDPDEIKQQYLDYYFAGSGVEVNHPNIDWGEGATSQQEAMRRFTSSVAKILAERPQAQNQTSNPKSEVAQLLEQVRAEREALEASKGNAIEEAKAQARRETEERLRKLGIDAGSTPVPTEPQRRIQTELSELDESLLTKGDANSGERIKARQQFDQQLASLRAKLISQMQ